MKKYLIGALVCITLLASLLLVGCGKKEGNENEGGAGTNTPTQEQTQGGSGSNTPTPGQNEGGSGSNVPAHEHTFETVEHKDATCTEDGVQGGEYCTVCNEGKEAAETVIPAVGHQFDEYGFCAGEGCEENLYVELFWFAEELPFDLTPVNGKVYVKYHSACAREDYDPIDIYISNEMFPVGTTLEEAKAESLLADVDIYKNGDFEKKLNGEYGGGLYCNDHGYYGYMPEKPLEADTDYYFVISINEENLKKTDGETVPIAFYNLYRHFMDGDKCHDCGKKCDHVFSNIGRCKYCNTVEETFYLDYGGEDLLPGESGVIDIESYSYVDEIKYQIFFDDENFSVSIYDSTNRPVAENIKSGDAVSMNGEYAYDEYYYNMIITNVSGEEKNPDLMWYCADNACVDDEDEDGFCDVCDMPFAFCEEVHVGDTISCEEDDCFIKLDLSQKPADYKVTLALRGKNCGAIIFTSMTNAVALLDDYIDVFTATVTGGRVYYIEVGGSDNTKFLIVEGTDVPKVTPHLAWDEVYTLDKDYDGIEVIIPLNAYYSNNCDVSDATVEWFRKGNDTPLTSAPKDAGEYTLVVRTKENAVYNTATLRIDFTISKAETSIAFNKDYAPSKIYDGKAVAAPTADDYTVNPGGSVTVEWYQGETKLGFAPVNPGTYTVKILIGDDNHEAAEDECTFTISSDPKLVMKSVADNPEVPYQGTVIEGILANDVKKGDRLVITGQNGTVYETTKILSIEVDGGSVTSAKAGQYVSLDLEWIQGLDWQELYGARVEFA